MSSTYYRMDSRSAQHPVAWPLVHRVGVELASVSSAMETVRSETGEIQWNESEVRVELPRFGGQ